MKKVLSLLCIALCFWVAGCGSDEKPKEAPKPAAAAVEPAKPVKAAKPGAPADIDKYLAEALAGKEQGSTARADAIAKLAKKDAAERAASQNTVAVDFIVATYPNFYADAATMEKAMYYGYLLDYSFGDGDPRSRVGYNTVKSIKYVYRGAEKATDDATQKNLKKIAKDLPYI